MINRSKVEDLRTMARVKRIKNIEVDYFVDFKLAIPRDLYKILRDLSAVRKVPITRLICFAIDKEIDSDDMFDYPTPDPLNEFIEDAYTNEAGTIFRMLKFFKGGLSRDQLMLFRRGMGMDKETVMLAVRELLKSKMVHEVPIGRNYTNFEYPPEYKVLRMVEEIKDDKKAFSEQKRYEMLKRELELSQKKLDKYKGVPE